MLTSETVGTGGHLLSLPKPPARAGEMNDDEDAAAIAKSATRSEDVAKSFRLKQRVCSMIWFQL